MKHSFITGIFFCFITTVFGQLYTYDMIPQGLIVVGEDGGERAGSCASPNGAILAPTLTDYPTFNYMNSNGYCYNISPAVKNATYCFTFTSPGTTALLNAAFATTGTGGYSYYFDNFYLYTCAPACVAEPAYTTPYFTWTGLTVGQCYTFCFDTHFTGGGPSGGFTKMCPYLIYTVPLPITLESFTAYSESGTIQLNWETATETDCMEFIVERSGDGVNFEAISVLPGHGTTTTAIQYAFKDDHPLSGSNYYRLRQVDYNYVAQLSDVIACDLYSGTATHAYYALNGQVVDIERAPSGVYVHEIVSGMRVIREKIYHTAVQ